MKIGRSTLSQQKKEIHKILKNEGILKKYMELTKRKLKNLGENIKNLSKQIHHVRKWQDRIQYKKSNFSHIISLMQWKFGALDKITQNDIQNKLFRKNEVRKSC